MAEQRNQGTEQPGHGVAGASRAVPPGATTDRDRDSRQPTQSRPPRTMKAMLFSMVPLVLVAFGVGASLGQCSFSPLGPSIDQNAAPKVDVGKELARDAKRVPFPVLVPELPGDWRANSESVEDVAGTRAVRTGWLTADARYLRLSQSNAAEEQLVDSETGQPPRAKGAVDAGGRHWTEYPGVRSEQAWVSDRDGVRLLITGNGTDPDFRQLAGALEHAPTLP